MLLNALEEVVKNQPKEHSQTMAKLCRRLKYNTPESPQWVGAQEVVEANVLVSCYVDHLENNQSWFTNTQQNIFKIILSLVYRLIGDNQLDDWQRVEHSNGSNVPGGGSGPKSQNMNLTVIMSNDISLRHAAIVYYCTKLWIKSSGFEPDPRLGFDFCDFSHQK